MLDTIENFVQQQDNTELSLHFQLKHASGPCINVYHLLRPDVLAAAPTGRTTNSTGRSGPKA